MAGSIVGSGELIATTKVGAEVGFTFLWLIIAGCAIKTFTQIELGRQTVVTSRTSLAMLNEVPGPRLRVNWILWYWIGMTALVVTQQGGIVGSIGEALSAAIPLTDAGRLKNQWDQRRVEADVYLARVEHVPRQRVNPAAAYVGASAPSADIERWKEQKEQAERESAALTGKVPDAKWWSLLVAIITAVMMGFGRYRFVQGVSIVLVAAFTATSFLNLLLLQLRSEWSIGGADLAEGLRFSVPLKSLATALSAFGLIGVGSAELLQYPYWCLEKGYARAAGPRDDTSDWAERARGWIRVMVFDAWLSMVVFTFSTLVFYLLGAGVLWRCGLVPSDGDLVRTLTVMYVPIFGRWAPAIFLFGAFAVLYSTYFVSAASNSLIVADGIGLCGWGATDPLARSRRMRVISIAWPLIAFALYMWLRAPVAMVLLSGVAQMLMLPMIGAGTLWLRYRRGEPRLRPSLWFDVGLWLSMAGFLVAAGGFLYAKLW